MNTNTINCPNCGEEISVEQVLAHKLRESMQEEYESKLKEKEKDFSEREKKLRKRETGIKAGEKKIQEEVQKGLDAQSKKIEASLRVQIQEDFAIEMQFKDDALKEKKEQLTKAKKRELELLQKEEELKEQQESLKLEVARKLSEERDELIATARKQYAEEHELKDLEKDKAIEDQKKQLEEMKRRLEQGSMQLQGEIQEESIEEMLISSFPIDEIIPIKPGTEGADVLHKVKNTNLQSCGRVLWESKNTKNWGGTWIRKLKDDQIEAGADIAVLVTRAMPKDWEDEDFGHIDGVWIIKRSMVLPVAHLLRSSLMQVTIVRNSQQGMDERMRVLHGFLISAEFRNRMEAIIHTFRDMQSELETEKRSYTRVWNKRQKAIDRVLQNVAGMWGDFQDLLGSEIGTISSLELESPDDALLLDEVKYEELEKAPPEEHDLPF